MLLGEIIQGAEGWMIEEGILTRGDDGFRLQSSEMVQIAALGVTE